MSRILRRPMFRGGMPIDSRGTGITSGLYDGGRVGYFNGGQTYSIQDILGMAQKPLTGRQIVDFAKTKNLTMTPNIGDQFKVNPTTMFFPSGDTEVELTSGEDTFTVPFKDVEKFTGEKIKGEKNYLGMDDPQGSQDEIVDLTTEEVTEKLKPKPGNNLTGNETIEPEVSAEDAIRENAELFKELLGEASEEDIKKARIADASDYALKLFEETIGKGKGFKEAAGAVAGFATGRASRVDKAKEAAKKTDQTAVALAINDYIAGKRSKEDIAKMFAGLKLKAEYAKGSLGEAFADFRKSQGTLGAKDMEVIIKGRVKGAVTEIIPKGSGEYKPNPDGSDEGKFYIEEETKDVYRVINGNKVKVF